MSKKQKFIDYVEAELFSKKNLDEIDEDVKIYWEACKAEKEVEKPLFTDTGKLVLSFMKEHSDISMFKSKTIGDEIGMSSRIVSGAMRKLVENHFVDKIGTNPVIYMLTESGKNINLD